MLTFCALKSNELEIFGVFTAHAHTASNTSITFCIYCSARLWFVRLFRAFSELFSFLVIEWLLVGNYTCLYNWLEKRRLEIQLQFAHNTNVYKKPIKKLHGRKRKKDRLVCKSVLKVRNWVHVLLLPNIWETKFKRKRNKTWRPHSVKLTTNSIWCNFSLQYCRLRLRKITHDHIDGGA